MNKLTIASIIVAAGLIVSAFLLRPEVRQTYMPLGGSDNYNNATTTRTDTGTALTSRQIKTGPGALGTVVITGANTGLVTFWDTNGSGTTTLAQFPASVAAGTYVFDAAFSRGLYVDVSGAVATATVTWR